MKQSTEKLSDIGSDSSMKNFVYENENDFCNMFGKDETELKKSSSIISSSIDSSLRGEIESEIIPIIKNVCELESRKTAKEKESISESKSGSS